MMMRNGSNVKLITPIFLVTFIGITSGIYIFRPPLQQYLEFKKNQPPNKTTKVSDQPVKDDFPSVERK
ncbi:hypothetical protein CROQUDRAFT_663955 [Cronartium quercuum f. sp. fusiforme G11]|uniref:Uncharacterized protein n=1 Tax=Cronartium quercuum f. sp. fusiforme G11 TaxID=708437 RepID=A0A9P6NBS6_9BASI|nr:hypothetical protein CROQUDRAFT_663955 [Cronartium quercuum f. sp. fusiforme G11]